MLYKNHEWKTNIVSKARKKKRALLLYYLIYMIVPSKYKKCVVFVRYVHNVKASSVFFVWINSLQLLLM